MKITYTPGEDALYIEFLETEDGPPAEDIAPGVALFRDYGGRIVGIDFFNLASKRVDLTEIVYRRRGDH